MAQGPGKYDDLCTQVRERAQAAGAVVMVIDGNHGTGFSVQVVDRILAQALPGILRQMADEIDRTENPKD